MSEKPLKPDLEEDEDEDDELDENISEEDDEQNIDLRKNHKSDLECIGFILVVSMIVMIAVRLNNDAFTLWWIVVPIALFIALWMHAERYQKNVNKLVLGKQRVRTDWQYSRESNIKRCFDANGLDAKSIPDDEIGLYDYIGIVNHERVTQSTADLRRILQSLENQKILKAEGFLDNMDKIEQSIKMYGGDAADGFEIEIIQLESEEHYKCRNRNRWDITTFSEVAFVYPTSMNAALGNDTNVIPAAGWKFEHPNSASQRVFHVGVLFGDLPVYIVTGCAYLDRQMGTTPTADETANVLTRISEKIYERAHSRSGELRKLLNRAREKLRAKRSREKRVEGERTLDEIEAIRRNFRVDNLDDRKPKPTTGSKWGWVVLVMLIIVLVFVFA